MTEATVQLVNVFNQAYDNFVATARTCYSSKGLVSAADVAGPLDAGPSELELRRQRKHALAQSLFKAGHHTTLQHAHVQFALDKISRHFIWSFLHAHPFYNSEQVSQRYVAVKEENFYIPHDLGGGDLEKYLKCVRAQMAAYQHLSEMLKPVVAEEYFARFKGRYGTKRAETDIKKRAQEAARYVLPVATHAYLYHTVSVITLMRYYRLSQQYDTPAEQRDVIKTMVDELLAREPEFGVLLQEPLDLEATPEYAFFQQAGLAEVDIDNARDVVAEFDSSLNGATSVLIDYGARSETVIACAVREVLGLKQADLPDAAALELVLDPSRNALLGESMNLTTLSKLSRTMFHAHYVFRKVLSHAADSQDQRHRMTPGSRPVLMRHFTGEPDFVTPEIIRKDAAVQARYTDSMEQTWSTINDLLAAGVTPENVSYLLPNAVKVRFTESGDLLNLHHKMAMRLCYNAQEEIWRASLDEAQAITAVHPQIGKWLLPPCGLRKHAAQKPICPEGDRYCGVPVWRLEREQYQRVI
ncbi:MAG: FAD-dependent thymidylate synthase [Candidatus Sumerlaeaceae bacterium]